MEGCEEVNCEGRGKTISDILTYSGACCGLSFMSVDPVRRQIRCLMLLKSRQKDQLLLEINVFLIMSLSINNTLITLIV